MSPEKATGSQETAPLADRSQEISAAQSQSSCSALPAPHPSPRPAVGREGPGCFTSSPIVFQTMGKVPLSQTRDSPRHRPKLGQRGEGRLWGKKLSAKPVGQRLRRVGEEGRKTKMSWVQPVPTTPCWTPARTLTARAHVLVHLSTSACLGPSTTRSGRGCEAMLHRGYSRAVSGGDRHSARQLYKYPAR